MVLSLANASELFQTFGLTLTQRKDQHSENHSLPLMWILSLLNPQGSSGELVHGSWHLCGGGSETAAWLFHSPTPLKMVGAPLYSRSPGSVQSQCLLNQASSKSCLSCITSCSLVLNVLVSSASPSCQKEAILWESILPLRLMSLCPLLSLLKKVVFVIDLFRMMVRLTCLLPC